MKKLISLIVLVLPFIVSAQTDTSKIKYGWQHSMVSALTLSQISFSNWSQGGQNSFSYTISGEEKSVDEEPAYRWINAYHLAYGQAKIGSQATIKTDDRLEFESVLTYKIGSEIDPYIGATLKTQFAAGYTYGDNGDRTKVSNFFDPGYMTEGAGFGYRPEKVFKTRLGLAVREIVTKDFRQYANEPGIQPSEMKKVSVRGGMESVTNVEFSLDENVLFTTQLELFGVFTKLSEGVVRNNTSITAKVGKFVTVLFSIQFINEKAATPRTQVKQTLGMGISYTLF